MAIEFKCTKCGKTLNVKDEFSGKKGKCACGNVIRIPSANDNAEKSIQEKQDVSILSEEVVMSSETHSEVPNKDLTKKCPFCGEVILQEATKCRFCGEMLYGYLYSHLGNEKNGRSFAITSMVLGILSIWLVPLLILGVLALIFGKCAKKKMIQTSNFSGKGMATAGVVLGIVTTAFGLLIWVLAIIAMLWNA